MEHTPQDIAMVAKILLVSLSLIGLSLGSHLQDSRQFLYQQQQQQQQPARQYLSSQYHQLPAATHLLPNNVNDGVRYGQQSLVYVMPQGSQYLYEEGAEQPQQAQPGGAYVESFFNLVNNPSGYHQAASDPKPVHQQPGVPAGAEKPERLQAERPSLPTQAAQQQHYLQQLAAQEQIQYLQQEAQRHKFMALSSQPQYFQQQQRPAAASPHNLFYYSFPQQQLQQYAQADKTAARPHHPAALGFQKLLLRSGQEQNNASSEISGEESQETQTPSTQEEIGPSIAQAKPQAISVAGPGGVAAAAPVGTAVVGPGGMALSAPSATALAGTKPRPGQQPGQATKLRQALRYAY
ncbi:antigen LPMC-61 [Halyomorpha halys]|uniref:antigen LPMC-61 n=1 Tax=Halyomorpha halys TaxID=286706 RepID=UPI0006D4E378|nr:transcription factor SPT20 homolog [Halyomorpha halys]